MATLSSTSTEKSTTVRSRTELRLARAALQASYVLSEDLGNSLAERLFTSPRRFERPARERGYLATARPVTFDVTLRSPRWAGHTVELAGWRWGFGPAVLLVHGWEGRGSQLGALVEPLVAAGLSVVTFDAPAHGDSDGKRLYLTDFADAIADVAAVLRPQLHAIVAHSFGAAATLLARARHGTRAEQHVFIAPNAVVDSAVAMFAARIGLDETDRMALEAQLGASSGLAFEDLRLASLVGDLAAEDALVIHDHDDKEIPLADGVALAMAIEPGQGGARVITTSGLGHRRILRDPGVIAATVAECRKGISAPVSDLVREVDRQLLGE